MRALLDKEIPTEGHLLVVAHSMGSLVALDLLHEVPKAVRVLGLITLGSPLVYPNVQQCLGDHHRERAASRSNVWVNIVDPKDPITGGAGLASSWPQASRAIDVHVDNKLLQAKRRPRRHEAERYLAQPAFGVALTLLWPVLPAPLEKPSWSPVAELPGVRPKEQKGTIDGRVSLPRPPPGYHDLTPRRER